jgi:hypothetical protein
MAAAAAMGLALGPAIGVAGCGTAGSSIDAGPGAAVGQPSTGVALPAQAIAGTDVGAGVKWVDDPFRPFKEFATARQTASTPAGLGGKRLVARRDRKTGILSTLLEVEIAYLDDHRRHYETARTQNAEPLEVIVVHRTGRCRTGGSCPFSDVVHVVLPEARLRAATEGLKLKLFARRGPDLIVTVPPDMIRVLFAAVDGDRARHPAAAVPARPG